MTEVRFGIIGCGTIAPIHAKAIQATDKARLVAVSDVVEENARKLADEFQVEAFTDYRAMLERDDVDAVCLCVPSGLRVNMGEACAEAGKHILAEKPLEVTTERIDRLIEATDRARVKLGCIFQFRFSNGSAQVRQAIDDGRFGRLVLGDAYIKWFRSQEYYDSGAWRGTRQLDGGGALMNQGIHQIDLLLWFFGPAKTVHAQTALLGHEGLEVEDLACAMLTFENNAMGVVEGSTAIWPGHAARVEVHGTQGSAVVEDGNLRFWQFQEETPDDEEVRAHLSEDVYGSGAGDPIKGVTHEGHRRQVEDFVEAIIQNRTPAVDGHEGRRAVALIEAIYRSAQSGETVDL